MKQDAVIVLGSGYTARFMPAVADDRYTHMWLTSRDPDNNLSDVPPAQRLRFDLEKEDTWRNMPPATDLLWCFPAVPLESVRRFAAYIDGSSRRLVVLGSTSAYEVSESPDYPPPWIDETAPIDVHKPRVQGEEFLRTGCGAIVLRIAGIYGPGRNPLEWIKSGLVGPSRKYVNLIHVEDLAAACLAALQRGKAAEVYNVSDGTPRTWEEICRTARYRWGVLSPTPALNEELGKRIDTGKLTKELGVRIRHPDLYGALADLTAG